MEQATNSMDTQQELTLVLGGTGKTGQRIVQRLKARGVPTRVASRRTAPAFDWHEPASWDAALAGVRVAYISYAPDLAVPGATRIIQAFVDKAVAAGVKRLVLLSGRGETEAQACERIVQASGVDWTVLRCSWFNQNFSEGAFLPMVQAGEIALPAGSVPEPFIDVDDIADVAVAALTEEGHAREVYEVTGPRLLTLAEAASEISSAAGRDIRFTEISHADFAAGLEKAGLPYEYVWLLDYLFSTVLDGRNASLADGVQRALGREPRDFTHYASEIAATGLWSAAA